MYTIKQFFVTVLFCVVVIFLSHAAVIAGSPFEPRVHEGHLCARNAAWLSARNFTFELESKIIEGKPSCALQLLENNNMVVRFDGFVKAADGKSGEAMLVAGRALLTRNVEIEENYAIDILDGLILSYQLVITLIDLASEEGPLKSSFPFHRKIAEATYPIKVTTQSAGGLYNAPWEADINLVKDEKGTIHYKIAFSFTQEKDRRVGMMLMGQLSNYGEKNTNKPLEDDFNIVGWKQYNIGPYTKNTASGTIYDYGTTYIVPPHSTVGQLRKYIAEKEAVNKEGRNK